jgi:hypothetical protein
MTIIEKPLQGFNTKLKFDKLNYPQCSCGNCPKFYWNLLSIASRQSGKTHSICQLIKHYETHKIVNKDGDVFPVRTFLISPTTQANQVYHSLSSLDFSKDVYEDYSDNILLDIIADIKDTKQEIDDFRQYIKAYKLYLKTPEEKLGKLFETEPELMQLLEKNDYAHWTEIDQPRYQNYPVNIIILDDLLGTGSFSTKHKSALTNAFIKNRHLNICFAVLSQSLKAIPKNMRLNSSVFFLGKFQNKGMILNDIYEEVSNVCTMDQFEQYYTHSTDKPYGALILDLTDGKRFLSNFDTELFLKDDSEPENKNL